MTLQTPSALVVEGVPTNLRLPEGSRATHVDGDLYGIAERLKEIDPSYLITLLEHVDGRAVWAICEVDAAGTEALIFRVGPGCQIDELDARVIERVQYLRTVPVRDRLALLEKEAAAEKAAREAERSEKMWEDLGAPMYSQLARLGFVDTPRVESMRPLNTTATRSRGDAASRKAALVEAKRRGIVAP